MSFDGFLFSLKNAVYNIFRNYVLTIASVIVLSVCLLSLGSTFLVVQDVDMIVDSVGSENRVVVFLEEDISQVGINDFEKKLGSIKNITNVVYESPQQSLENYTEQLGQESVEGLDASVFRPSFIFDLIDLNKYEQTIYEIQNIEGLGVFESGENAGKPAIRSTKSLVDTVVKIKQVLSFFSGVVIVVFFILSLFIITNSVKMSVFARRTEINIMTYVGATDFYIQLPYFIEGLLIGIFSGVLSFFVERLLYKSFISPVLGDLVRGISLFDFDAHFGLILALFVAFGGIIGVFGSVIPVKKYLNV